MDLSRRKIMSLAFVCQRPAASGSCPIADVMCVLLSSYLRCLRGGMGWQCCILAAGGAR
jgi:hypothetical protein